MKIRGLLTCMIVSLVMILPLQAQVGKEMKAFRNKEGVTVTLLTPSLYSLYKQGDLSLAAEDALKNIKEINVMQVDIERATPKVTEDISRRLSPIVENESKYNLVRSHRGAYGQERLYVTQADERITSLMLWSEDAEMLSIIELKGNIRLDKVDEIADALNVKGLDRLAYINMPASRQTGTSTDFIKKMEERFDYVTLIGVLEYAKSYIGKDNPYPEYLEKINRLLKPGGKILIAIENRLGLKYFAGCREDHVGREFAGIEGYPGIDFVETFSKPELEQMLQENGFSKFKFYYPYPDYKFPAVIYSDEYLPKPGELRKNQRNFDADRITLFDEGKAFDGILKSGLFPVFSNSFLIEVEKKE